MRAVVQRVSRAEVQVEGMAKARIGRGFLVLVGIFSDDSAEDLVWLAKRIAQLRIFPDEEGKMNLSPLEVRGEILLVSQFTLCANVKKGNRPSFIEAMEPTAAERMVEQLAEEIRAYGLSVQMGVFGAKMEVELVNEGPVTILLDSKLFRGG